MRGPRDRPTTDLIILLLAATVCGVVVVSTAAIAVVSIADPDADTSPAGQVVANVINTLIGLVAGWLAGRTERGGRDR